MQITVKLYAMLTEYLPSGADKNKNAVTLDLAEGVSVAEVIERLRIPKDLVHLVLLNGVYIEPEQLADTRLKAADVLAIWPPVAGG